MRRWLLWCAVALAGCSALVDWSADGLPCDADGTCRDGYVCTASRVCVAETVAVGTCPCASPFEACVDGACAASCDQRPCGAGEVCASADGLCHASSGGGLGARCTADADCATDAFCLASGSGGVCTRRCEQDADCGEGPLTCRTFDASAKLCAAPSLTVCGEGIATLCRVGGLTCRSFAGGGVGLELCDR
ncbi:MAG: Dickkopf N-terminal cysteine-rich region [Pseudomonadota bacterium]|jgi:hypothetical protein